MGIGSLRRALLAGVVLSIVASSVAAAAATEFPAGYQAHHTFAELRAELKAIAAARPDIVALRSMGRSYNGRKLFVVKVSDNVGRDENEPEAYVDGGIHGDEHISTEQALSLIRWLADGHGSDEQVTALVDTTEIWIAPLVNPDGATYDIADGWFRNWRKNRKPNPDGSLGTDINRNFAYQWGAGPGSSGDPGHDMYRGPRPWSTPEARRIRDFIRSRVIGDRQQISIALTIHAHGEFVMYPFGYTSDPAPPDMRPGDADILAGLAAGIAERNGYRPLRAGELYRSAGTFMEWAYARQRILALTLEMAPPASVDDGHYVPDEQLSAELERNREALLWFLGQAATWWK